MMSALFNFIELYIENNSQEFCIRIEKIDSEIINLVLSGDQAASDSLKISEMAAAFGSNVQRKVYGIMSGFQSSPNFGERAIIDNSQVLSFIRKLPSPIFLGLDRTALLSGSEKIKVPDTLSESSSKNFRTALDEALEQAVDVVIKRMAVISAERNKLYAETQTKLILSLFDYSSNNDEKETIDIRNYDEKTVVEISRMQSNVISGLRKIKIANSEIDKLVVPFFKEVETRAVSAHNALKSQMRSKKDDDRVEFYQALNEWFGINPYLNIVNLALKILRYANDQEASITAIVENYKNTINSFLGDSRKSIEIEEDKIEINLPNGRRENIKILSSGERQIFVLITHLAMNPDMQKTNVLIIDEPELSLHLKWQKQFVKSVQKVSPRTQIILATHSPEIINKMTSKTISLG